MENALQVIVQNFIVEEQIMMVVYEVARTSTYTRSGLDGYREYTEGLVALLANVLGISTLSRQQNPRR